MIIGARRAILIAVIAAVGITIVMIPLIFSLTATGLDKVQIRLADVKVGEPRPEDLSIPLKVVFAVLNPTSQALTTSKVDYELFADGKSLGTYVLSYEDVPPPGRPPFFQNQPTNLTSSIILDSSKIDDQFRQRLQSSPSAIQWTVSGSAEIDAALTTQTIPVPN